jgi:DNA-directed RNA polymerase specialized sigma24 family protein
MAGRETSHLQSSLAILSPVLREPIVLCHLQEMTYRETPSALGDSRGHCEITTEPWSPPNWRAG